MLARLSSTSSALRTSSSHVFSAQRCTQQHGASAALTKFHRTTAISSAAPTILCSSSASAIRSFSNASTAPSSSSSTSASTSSTAPLVAPAFGTNSDKERRFVYIKGVKNDGRSKRFYGRVDIIEVPTTRGTEYGIQLDGRFVVTPYNQILSAPTNEAAVMIAFEWDTQGDFIRPISMPLTNICVTALDQAFTDRARFITHFKSAMSTDSVLLRTNSPSGLVAQHKKLWDPLLAWMSARYGIKLQTTLEFVTPPQSADATAKLSTLLNSLTGWQLASLDSLTTVTKSFIISWALLTDRVTIEEAFESARLEENFQMRQFGQVEGVYGHGIDMEFTRMSLAAAKTWMNVVTQDANQNPLLKPDGKQ